MNSKGKTLFIVRGLPGSGKSTFAEMLAEKMVNWFEADMFFEHAGEYKFEPKRLPAAHGWCQLKVETAMQEGFETVVVSNTFTRESELAPYVELATKYGYKVVSTIVENRHGGCSVHDVPLHTMEAMEKRFSVKLR